MEGENPGDHDIEFNFENESLKHREGHTMRTAKYEVSETFKAR